MKKFLYIMIAAIALLGFASCSSNTPSAVVKKAYACMQKNDIDGYMQYVGTDDDSEKSLSAMKQKVEMALAFQGGIKSYEITDEEIGEDGESATVKVDVTFGNGKTENTKVKLKKFDGKWKITD